MLFGILRYLMIRLVVDDPFGVAVAAQEVIHRRDSLLRSRALLLRSREELRSIMLRAYCAHACKPYVYLHTLSRGTVGVYGVYVNSQ